MLILIFSLKQDNQNRPFMSTRQQSSLVLLTIGTLLFSNQIAFNQNSQDAGHLSGNLETVAKFFIRDSVIGAFGTPQYDRQLYGGESWLNLLYSRQGFDIGLRFDIFLNSNLPNPKNSYSDQGIGRWFIRKKIHKLDITGGYIYDAIGSGIIFRAYEERAQAIDQALYGLNLEYDLSPNWRVKAFTGRQKQQFDSYKSIIRGASVDGYITADSANLTVASGIGIVSRTLDDESMNNLVATLNTYLKEDIYSPKYNSYAVTAYNTLTTGPFVWYLEGAYKTKDSFVDPFASRVTSVGDTVIGNKVVQRNGHVIYSTLSYANHGLGITMEGKRTENFDFRTRPQEEGSRGLVHFIPPMSRVNTYRLLARYTPATQYVGELAFQVDVKYAFNNKLRLNLNFSNIENLKGEQLYRELYGEVFYKHKRNWTINAGVQLQRYNQDIYQGKPGTPMVRTFTPYTDFLYKMNRTNALRVELQYMHVAMEKGERADYGSWLFGLAELTLAPHWSITLSDMVNVSPGKLTPLNPQTGKSEVVHFTRIEAAYTFRSNRFSLGYIKQPEGIICSGGICRLEPAFYGVSLNVFSSF